MGTVHAPSPPPIQTLERCREGHGRRGSDAAAPPRRVAFTARMRPRSEGHPTFPPLFLRDSLRDTLLVRLATTFVLSMAMLGCGPPHGQLLSIAGGFGGGEIEVFRNARRSWLFRRSSPDGNVEVEVEVTVTFHGLREYEDAQAEVPEAVEGQLSSCLAVDGVDAEVWLEHSRGRFASFCAHRPPPEVERLGVFWNAAVDVFEECRETRSFRLRC
jgi:hypothetical protein